MTSAKQRTGSIKPVDGFAPNVIASIGTVSLLCHIPATTSISTNAPFGKVFTATADLAGYGSVKNSA